jgi:hypothetical protein
MHVPITDIYERILRSTLNKDWCIFFALKYRSQRSIKMNDKPAWEKLFGIVLIMILILSTALFSLADPVATLPLGSIVSTGNTTIGGTTAPSGTTIFVGDKITSVDATLINLNSGSKGDALLVRMNKGLLRFNFNDRENVQIEAGEYRFMPTGDSGAVGELGMNQSGQIAMNLQKGSFKALNTITGIQTEITVATPFAVMDLAGKGRIVNDGNSVSDDFLSLGTDSLRGQCIVAGNEAYAISGNNGNRIMINGNWGLRTDEYTYQVVACTEEAMVQAGASREAARNAVVTSVFGVQPTPQQSHTARNAAILAGIGGGVVIPVAIKAMGNDEKSQSSR